MQCPRKHLWRYECGIVPDRTAPPLRFGTLWHLALELYGKGVPVEQVYARLHEAIDEANYYTEDERELERHTVLNMLAGYLWYWKDAFFVRVLATEEEFAMPLYGSDGLPTGWQLAGKRDARVMVDGRELVMEHKTSSEDLAPDSAYWARLRMDPQISIYLLSARMVGSRADSVLYNVARKPTIRLKKTETPAVFGERLLGDIQTRPDYYYQRQEIPRLEQDLAEATEDVLASVKMVEHYRRENYWPRNPAACCRFGKCAYWDLCTSGYQAGEPLPAGYTTERIHAELSIGNDDE